MSEGSVDPINYKGGEKRSIRCTAWLFFSLAKALKKGTLARWLKSALFIFFWAAFPVLLYTPFFFIGAE